MALIAVNVEGTVSEIKKTAAGAEIEVMGMTVIVDPGIEWKAADDRGSISTPTAKLTIAQLTDVTPLPGRAEPGFKGGTVIAKGNFDTTDGKIHVRIIPQPANQGNVPFELHPSIAIEPGESVIEGAITLNAAGDIQINGVKIVPLPDPATNPRMPGKPLQNEEGFDIKSETIINNSFGVANGYFAADGVFHAYEIQATGSLKSTAPQISIIRTEARNGAAQYALKLRGFVTTSHLTAGLPRPRIVIFRQDKDASGQLQPTILGSASPAARAGVPFVRWDFDQSITALASPLNAAPDRIFVRYDNAPTQPVADLDVDVRFD